MPDANTDKESNYSGTPSSTGAVSYERLKDPESEGSSVNLQFTESLDSINSFVSESNQTLLGNERDFENDDSAENDNQSLSTHTDSDSNSREETLTASPLEKKNDLVESESYLQSCGCGESVSMSGEDQEGVKIQHTPASPHASVSSEADIGRFDIDVNSGQKLAALDGQSIDSHMFAMLDHEMKSSTTLAGRDITEDVESSTNASDEGLGLKVRFEGTWLVKYLKFRDLVFLLFAQILH